MNINSLPNVKNIELFVEMVHASIAAGHGLINIMDIPVSILTKASLDNSIDDFIVQKNGGEYHAREKLARAYESEGYFNMAAHEWKACAWERAENCAYVAASIDAGHLKAIEYCIAQSKRCWQEFSGQFALPSEDVA
ncbi:hypothetical protein [Xanthomonas arboricola]|uniref:hypothetical protein n=1 Tax=Xanthomonas arboricola TaxID=56448 RepID=UPI00129072D7|nr:hypothetical protein [Xanthomonas arboricola]